MSLMDIGPVIFGSKEGLVDYLRRFYLITLTVHVVELQCVRDHELMYQMASAGGAHNAKGEKVSGTKVFSKNQGCL